jgi:NADH dehydrogenase [ubiquinone] 1 alpha subcomplex assembly factor 1
MQLQKIFFALLLSLSWLTVIKAEEGERVLFEFDKPKADEGWRNVNDNVMGGVSEGKLRITDDKTLEFYGNLSLEHNGGFASVRCRDAKLDLSKYEAVRFKVRGDGRTYWFNINVPSFLPAFSYRATFPTEAGKWQEIQIPLKDFRATAFGQEVPGTLDPSKVEAVGFLLYDKKAGPFRLEVAWIKVVPKATK